MATELFANQAATTLTADITAGATSMSVASAALFPVAVAGVSVFRIKVENEILLVTASPGTTWTIVRGYEGTTAAAHVTGTAFTHIITAGALSALIDLPGLTYKGAWSGTSVPQTTYDFADGPIPTAFTQTAFQSR